MPLRDLLLALTVPLTWGLGFTFAKAGLSEFPPLLLMGMRFCVTALVLVWFFRPPRGHLRQIFWIALIGATIQYGLTFTGLEFMDASLAVIVVQLEVPFATLLAVIVFRERPGWRRLFGIVVAFAGIALIAGQPTLATSWGRSCWWPAVPLPGQSGRSWSSAWTARSAASR